MVYEIEKKKFFFFFSIVVQTTKERTIFTPSFLLNSILERYE